MAIVSKWFVGVPTLIVAVSAGLGLSGCSTDRAAYTPSLNWVWVNPAYKNNIAERNRQFRIALGKCTAESHGAVMVPRVASGSPTTNVYVQQNNNYSGANNNYSNGAQPYSHPTSAIDAYERAEADARRARKARASRQQRHEAQAAQDQVFDGCMAQLGWTEELQ